MVEGQVRSRDTFTMIIDYHMDELAEIVTQMEQKGKITQSLLSQAF